MYKVENYLEKCILSCENQDISKDEYEIVCINDGSPDNSLKIAENFASLYSNIKVISRSNGGLSAARNTGIDNALGEYLFFVDSDDWIEMNCLKKITSVLESEKPDVLCICAANVLGNSLQRRMDFTGFRVESGPESMLSFSSPCAPFQIVRKSHLSKYNIRFCEGIYHEDVEYTPRMRYFAEKVCYLNDIIYYVYQNPNSITRTINVKKVFDVIAVVTPHVHLFAEKYVDAKYRHKYNEIICSAINTVLSRNYPLSYDDKQKVNKIMYENRYLFRNYCNSTIFRYKVEGLLFKLFPNYVVEVFNFMNWRFK